MDTRSVMWSESLLWALHAVHHSQRQMTIGSDKRNHVLDDLLRNSLIVLVSQLIGMAPAQFVTIVAITQLTESLSHTNVRLSFGRWGQRLVVGPRFHREHHSIAYDPSRPGAAGGCNFSILFPIWDMMFKTATFKEDYAATGIHDQDQDGGGAIKAEAFGRTRVEH